MLEEIIQLEGPHTIAAFILESVTGTNGVLVPPDGYMQGVRDLCTKHGILMICDEVMAGFGRTGEWFAINHWNVVPDMITMAKGLTSAYVQLGAVGMRRGIADKFNDKVFYGGLTYNSHPLACAAALASIQVYEDDKLLENARKLGVVMKELHAELARKHPSVGAARSIGLFGLIELVRDKAKKTPLAPFNGTSDEMAGAGEVLPSGRALHVRALAHVLHQPAAVHHRGAAARGVRDHRPRSRHHGPRRVVGRPFRGAGSSPC